MITYQVEDGERKVYYQGWEEPDNAELLVVWDDCKVLYLPYYVFQNMPLAIAENWPITLASLGGRGLAVAYRTRDDLIGRGLIEG
jgi:hypothetical protein